MLGATIAVVIFNFDSDWEGKREHVKPILMKANGKSIGQANTQNDDWSLQYVICNSYFTRWY